MANHYVLCWHRHAGVLAIRSRIRALSSVGVTTRGVDPLVKQLACACGDRTFAVRVDGDQQVGLLTCAREHHSLLLDSRDYWEDVLQDGRPKQVTCRCKGRTFEVELEYTFRATEPPDVHFIEIQVRCVACKAERSAGTIEIDYSPTAELVERPLDPIEKPWLKGKHTVITGYWLEKDIPVVIQQMEALGALIYVEPWREPIALRSARDAVAVLGDGAYNLYFAAGPVEFPEQRRDCWKKLPVIHLGSPYRMVSETGEGTLYCLQWATERVVAGRAVAQDAALVALGKRVLAWLPTHFTYTGRCKRCFDNPQEAVRLKL